MNSRDPRQDPNYNYKPGATEANPEDVPFPSPLLRESMRLDPKNELQEENPYRCDDQVIFRTVRKDRYVISVNNGCPVTCSAIVEQYVRQQIVKQYAQKQSSKVF